MNISDHFLEISNVNIQYAYERIYHCLDQVDEEAFWYKPSSFTNSIGIIIQHLCGNLRQWIISGIGGLEDIRDRPSEFKDENKLSKTELVGKFEMVIKECQKVISNYDSDKLLDKKTIQEFDEDALSAIYRTVTHLELHAGQITYITRLILGDEYKLKWVPKE